MPMSAIITGAGAGMGSEIAHMLSARGFHLSLLDRDFRAVEATAQRIRLKVPAHIIVRTAQCDVTDSVELSRIFHDHAAYFGGVDVVVNNAGVAEKGDLFGDPAHVSNWRSVLEIDLAAVVEGTRLAVNLMTVQLMPTVTAATSSSGEAKTSTSDRYARGGVVVNVASAGGLFPMPFSPVYAAAKAGVVMFCRSLEGLACRKDTPVAVRAFCPQFVDTALVADSLDDLDQRSSIQQRAAGNVGNLQSEPPQGFGSLSSSPPTKRLPLVLPAVRPSDLIAATGGRLITVPEAAAACVELLIDPGPKALTAPVATATLAGLPSCALFLTTQGPRWWHFGNGSGSKNESPRQRRKDSHSATRIVKVNGTPHGTEGPDERGKIKSRL